MQKCKNICIYTIRHLTYFDQIMPKKYYFSFLCLLIAAQTSFSQAPEYSFQHIGVNEGLSQGSVRDILEDQLGFIWFATADGLNRYDGYEFHTYHHHGEDTTSIISGDVKKIFKDSRNNLWLTTESSLSKYESHKDIFQTIHSSSKSTLYPLFEDNTHQLFCIDLEANIFVMDSKSGVEVTRFLLSEKLTQSEPPFFMVKDEQILIFTNARLFIFNCNQKKWSDFALPAKLNQPTSGLFFKNSFWIGNENGNLQHYNANLEFLENISISKGRINSISTSGNADLLIGSSKGMFFYSPFNHSKTAYFSDEKNKNTLSDNAVQCFMHDNSGNLWVGTNANGLNKSIYSHKKFDVLRSASYYQVKSTYKDTTTKQLFCGVFGKGLDIYELLSSSTIPSSVPSPNNYIYIEEANSKSVLLFHAKGIDLCDKETQKISSINYRFGNTLNEIQAVFCSQKYIFQIATTQGIFELNSANFSLKPIYTFPEPIEVTALHKNTDGYWIGTAKNLSLLKDGVLKPLISNVFVKSMLSDTALWIGTTSGLYLYSNRSAKVYDDKYGLANNFIYGVLRDDNGNIWCSTNRGLSRFNPKIKYFRNYDISDGIQTYEYNTGAYAKAADGMMLFGGVSGVNYFYPNVIAENPVTPKPLITNIRVNDDDFKSDTTIWYKKYLELPFEKNTISFDFVGLQYSNTERNEYTYQLVGVDKDWIYAGNRRFARYANLEPGIYVFKVRSANSDGHWNRNEASLTIRITAPFWMSWWFKGLIILFLLATAAAGIFYYQQRKIRIQRRQIEIQKQVISERERISRDLHDNIGAQITYIISSMDWAKNQIPEENTALQERFDHLRSNTQSVMSSLRDTIWTLNKKSITPLDFFDRLRQYVSYNIQRHSIIEVAFFELIECDHKMPPNVVLNLFRICQEAIQNVIKHANANVLTISIVCEKDEPLKIAISDDGNGFDRGNERDDSFGLENMRYRAEEIGANIQIHSAVSKGTSVEITLNIKE
jgi:signal transduction histidine kinase/ligand-binding sensor domain-containing protein